MNNISLKVENIKCGGCASSIKSGLLSIKGVNSIDINIPEGQINVEGDATLVRQIILDKLSKMGYPEEGKGSTLTKAKSYVSCMIGKMQG